MNQLQLDVQSMVLTLASPPETMTAERVTAHVDAVIEQVWSKVPGLPARVDAGTLSVAAVASVVLAVVQRVFDNPEGATSRSTTLGPYSESWSFRSGEKVPVGLLVTDGDVSGLLESAAVSSVRSFGIGLSSWQLP